jgi:hypothetical protein
MKAGVRRTAHREVNRAACRAGVVCECGHCACDHYGNQGGGYAWCDALTGRRGHECDCAGWRRSWVVLVGAADGEG